MSLSLFKSGRIVTNRTHHVVTVSVTRDPDAVGYTAIIEAADGTPELLGQTKTLLQAQLLADDSSGCPQPCFCPPWSPLTSL
jgi:hypothetical protein